MATIISLDEFIETAEEKYGDLVIPAKDKDGAFEVRLQPLLRLSQDRRDQIEDLLVAKDDVEEGEEKARPNPVKTLQDFVRLVADNEPAAERLISKIGDRADVLKEIQETWFEKTQAGEAKPSQS